MLCVSFILLVVLYALVPFSGKRITKLTNKVCFLSTNASYGMRIGSGTANKFPPERWSISKRSTVWENAKNPSPMALTMPYVYTCKWICIDTIISDLQKTWEKIKHPIPRLQHLERCNPQVGLSYEQTTVEIREIQPQVTSLLSPNETGKNPKRLQSYTKGMLRHHLESWGGPQETVARWDGLSRCSSTASVYQMMKKRCFVIAIDGTFFRILCLNHQNWFIIDRGQSHE